MILLARWSVVAMHRGHGTGWSPWGKIGEISERGPAVKPGVAVLASVPPLYRMGHCRGSVYSST